MEWSNKVCVSGPTSNDFLASDAISVGGEPCLLRMEGYRDRRLRDLNRRRRPGLCLPAVAIVSLWVATSGKPKLWADQNQTNQQQQPPPQTQQGETKKPQEPPKAGAESNKSQTPSQNQKPANQPPAAPQLQLETPEVAPAPAPTQTPPAKPGAAAPVQKPPAPPTIRGYHLSWRAAHPGRNVARPNLLPRR